MTKVKICGITNLEDALLSAEFGADELGFNFYGMSPRYIRPDQAREIIKKLPDQIKTVGVFVNESIESVIRIAHEAQINAVQLHGSETPDYAAKLNKLSGLRIIKAFRVTKNFDINKVLDYKSCSILLDAYSASEYGGTGETFDWKIAEQVGKMAELLYLAGGLNPENIRSAIENVRPYAVDACSGLEISKGIKDRNKLKTFFLAVNQAC